MQAIAILEKGAWDVRYFRKGRQVTKPVVGYRYRDLFVHRSISPSQKRFWKVTHMPSGLCFPFIFPSAGVATGAAIGLDRLRNNWTMIDRAEVNSIRHKAIEICLAHGGKRDSGGNAVKPRNNLNGYAN